MPFSLRNLTVLTYGNGYTHWHYAAGTGSALFTHRDPDGRTVLVPCTIQEALSEGFFASAADVVGPHDTVMITTGAGEAALCKFIGQGARLTARPFQLVCPQVNPSKGES